MRATLCASSDPTPGEPQGFRKERPRYPLEGRGEHDSMVRTQLMEMIEKRVRDESVLRLIRKRIQVGVIEEGRLLVSETGTGQGQTISPLLANIYLHGVLDEWFENEVKPRLRGVAQEIRFADDAVLCFQYKEDAEKVMEVLPKMFAKYGLTLHPEKTRLVEFGRYAEVNANRQGKKPGTLDFLGFTHICTRSRKGKFTVHIRTMKKRFRRGLTAIAEWCQENRRAGGRAAENPERQAPGPLPVLRTPDELPQHSAVLSGGPPYLEEVA
jgi:RNA-directed DNA polymerase